MEGQKYITIKEASRKFGIGQNTLRIICKEYPDKFVLFVGSKQLINEEAFNEFLLDIIKNKKVLDTY